MAELLITSSVLILIVAFLRIFLKGKISLRLRYALWLLVAVRLLIPVSFFTSPVSVMNAVEPVRTVMKAAPRASNVGVAQGPPVGVPAVTAPNTAPAAAPLKASTIAITVWLTGSGVMAFWFLLADFRFRYKLRRCAAPLADVECPLPVYVTGAVPSPCLYGLFRPAIYLTPSCPNDETALRHVLAHEYTHYRHGDQLWSLVRCICLAAYWFHPLVWLAAAFSRRDCELACDEGALKRLGEGERIPYGRTLLSMVVPKAAPADLLRTATTMTSGKGGLRERIALIAPKPKRVAAALAAALLVAAIAVGCTFTGAEKRPLEEVLTELPQDLQGQVVLASKEELAEHELLRAYYAEDYGTDWGGRLFEVGRISPVDFEQSYAGWEMSGGASYLGRDENWYYVRYWPTDVNFDPNHQEGYDAAYKGLLAWLEGVFDRYEGITPIKEDSVYRAFNANCTFPGTHRNVLYQPYYGMTGYGTKTDIQYTLLLSQPAKQGEGGIWCVDRWYDAAGNKYINIPNTDVTLAQYYAQLQERADAGEADWALEPLQVCVRYVKDYFGHDRPREAFTVGEVYEGEPQIDATGMAANESVQNRLDTISGGGDGAVILALEQGKGGPVKELTVSADSINSYLSGDYLTVSYTWSDQNEKAYFNNGDLTPETYDYSVTLYDQNKKRSFRFFSGSNIVLHHDETGNTWFEAVSAIAESDAATGMRFWYDSVELETVNAVTVTTDSRDFAQVARAWSEVRCEAMRNLSPGSRYQVLDARPYSENVYDTIEGDDTQFCFGMRLALKLDGDEEHMPYNAGAGLSAITEGPYTGYWAWGIEVVMRREGDTWRMLDGGSGGYRLKDYQ